MPTTTQFLTPVLVLVTWTLIMWVWMYATRIPAMNKAGVEPQDAAHPGTWVHRVPSSVRAVADNYNHLHEQPTIFYALMFFAALTGGGDATALRLAWAYVILRVLHSLVQATFNKVIVRFSVFALGTVALMVLAARQLLRVVA
ncbi:MAG TPA: MAPEG family protein [Steroidobacteraceae bacterium]|nr:MAPEG family protein [Steroidobacteraceae bacterium]